MKMNRRKWARLCNSGYFTGTQLLRAQAQSASPTARNFDQVAISPDGSRVAWVVQSPLNESGESTGGSAYLCAGLKISWRQAEAYFRGQRQPSCE